MSIASRGLEDVIIGDSAISLVEGERGGLSYRGYGIRPLVLRLGYEAVVHLLLHGELPNDAQLQEITKELAAHRDLPDGAAHTLDALDPRLAPMDALRTGLSAIGGAEFPYPPTDRQGLRLIAVAPTVLARFDRRRRGLPAVAPRPDLGHVANYLWMRDGTAPPPPRARALEQYFVVIADHGMNASTFALRVVLSTNSDLVSAAVAAIGTLKGPVHGGAPALVLAMLDAIRDPGEAETWIARSLDRGGRLFGFGHRAYKAEDPRAELLRSIAESVAEPGRFALARAVEEHALRELHRRKPEARLFTNVEFYAAVVLEAVGLSRDLFAPTFAVARTAGWASHALEQARGNRLIRPDVRYVGPGPRDLP